MSRNKIVRFVHNFTGLSFKESRQICKAAKWNEEIIISAVIEQYVDKIGSFVETFKPVFTELMDVIADVAANIAKQAAEIADCIVETIKSDPEIAAALLNSENPPVFAPNDAPTDSDGKLYEITQDAAETQQGGK